MLEIIDLDKTVSKKSYGHQLNKYQTELRALGYEVNRQQRPVVLVFEGWDAAGKGVIKRLTERLDPRGYQVLPIAAPRGRMRRSIICGASGAACRLGARSPSLTAVGMAG